jgi:hypothetical protein
MFCRTLSGSVSAFIPNTSMLPSDGFVRVIIHLIVVVLPAPFDPRNPNIS